MAKEKEVLLRKVVGKLNEYDIILEVSGIKFKEISAGTIVFSLFYDLWVDCPPRPIIDDRGGQRTLQSLGIYSYPIEKDLRPVFKEYVVENPQIAGGAKLSPELMDFEGALFMPHDGLGIVVHLNEKIVKSA